MEVQWDAYISYSSTDKGFVQQVIEALEERGVRVFYDYDLRAGDLWQEGLEENLLASRSLIVVVSPSSVTSDYIRRELEAALKKEMRVIPVLYGDLGSAEVPEQLAARKWVDFRNVDNFDGGVDELIRALDVGGDTSETEDSLVAGDLMNGGQRTGPASDVSPAVVQVIREGETAPTLLTCTPELAEVLRRATQISPRTESNFELSFTSLLLALLLPENWLARWFRQFAKAGGLDLEALYEKAKFDNATDLDLELIATELDEKGSGASYPYRLTASANNLITRAQRLSAATSAGSTDTPLGVRHLLGAFIYNERFHAEDWKTLAVDRRAWSEAFLRQVWSRHLGELDIWKREHRETFGEEPAVSDGPSTHIATDVWTTDDALGYHAYAFAISRFLLHEQTRPPLTISIQAPWGGGKTSLMRMIQQEVDPDAPKDARAVTSRPRGLLTLRGILNEVEAWIDERGAGVESQDLPRVQEGFEPRLLAAWRAEVSEGREARGYEGPRGDDDSTVGGALQSVAHAWETLQDEMDSGRDEEPLLLRAWYDALRRSLLVMRPEERADRGFEETFADLELNAGGPSARQRANLVAQALDAIGRWVHGAGVDGGASGEERWAMPLPSPSVEPRLLTVWFNAWKYESTNQVWAGLADAIIHQVAARLSFRERERFWLRLNLKRIDADEVRIAVQDKIFARFWSTIRGWLVALGSALAAAIGAMLWGDATGAVWAGPLRTVGLPGLFVIGSVVGAYAFVHARTKVRNEPATVSFREYLEIPDYGEELGFVHHVEADLQRVFRAVPERYFPIVVFIDDLDRCSPTKVAQVVEAINLFLAGDFSRCFFILGMDTEMVAAALQAAHKEVIACLPADAGSPVGWKFMDKFVQLPFLIPPAEPQDLKDYAATLFPSPSDGHDERDGSSQDSNGGVSTTDEIPPVEGAGASDGAVAKVKLESQSVARGMTSSQAQAGLRRRMDREIGLFNDQDPELRRVIDEAAPFFKNNPRELKRFVNVFRLHYFLWAVRRARSLPVPPIPLMVRWTIFSMRWPEVVRWLRRGGLGEWQASPDAGGGEREVLTTRMRVMEKISLEKGSREAWKEAIQNRFGLDDDDVPPWLEDDDLYVFLSTQQDEYGASLLLSEGAGRGLW